MSKYSSRDKNPKESEHHDLNSVMSMLEDIWVIAEQADGPLSDQIRKDIVRDIESLKNQIVEKVKIAPSISTTPTHQSKDTAITEITSPLPPASLEEVPRFPDFGIRVYAKDFAPQALIAIPQAAEFSSTGKYYEHLAATLPFNAFSTRSRAAHYFISRFFPGNRLHEDLKKFAKAAAGSPALPEALFYLTCRIERILTLVAESLVWPFLAEGTISRANVIDFVAEKFPDSKSAKQITSAIFRTYEVFGVGKITRTSLSVSQRQGTLPAFAYILHLEFPEPGMYRFDSMLQGPMQKWLLWDQAWMTDQLYALRQAGLLSKVSEIDSHRQFTTRFSLTKAMDRIVELAQEQQA